LYKYISQFIIVLSVFGSGVAVGQNVKADSLSTADSVSVDSIVLPAKNSKAITDPVDYSSKDSIRFVIPSRKVYVYGGSNILYEDIDLKADVIELDMDKREVLAYGVEDSLKTVKGKPHFEQGEEIFDAEKLRYNFRSERGLVYGVITEQSDGYLHSKVTKIQRNKEVHIKGGKYTTCDLDHPHFYVHMTKAKLIPEKQIVTGPAYLVIEDVPIPVAIPFGFFPNQKGRASGILIPSYGEEREYGYYLRDGGVYLGFNDYVDLALRADLYTMKSWRINANSNYALKYKFSGMMMFESSQMKNDEVTQDPSYKLVWQHNQDPKAHPTRLVSASVNFSKTSHNRLNATSYEQAYNNQTQSNINYSNRTANNLFNYSASFQHSQNSIDSTMSLTLPTLRVSMNNVYPFRKKNKLGKENFIDRFYFTYNTEAKNYLAPVHEDTILKGHLTFDHFQRGVKHTVPIGTSLKVLKYFTLSPAGQYTQNWYFANDVITYKEGQVQPKKKPSDEDQYGMLDTVHNKEFNVLHTYSGAASLSTKIYGMYTFRNDLVRAVRHLITPSVSYAYSPDFSDQALMEYYTPTKTVEYSPYAKSPYPISASKENQTLNFSVNSNLEMKVRNLKDTVTGTKKISLIKSLTVSSRYDLLADSLKWSDINVNASNTFFNRIDVKFSTNLNPYAMGRDSKTNLPRPINKYVYDVTGRPWRTQNTSWELSTSVNLGPVNKSSSTTSTSDEPKGKRYPGYVDFSLPWSFNISYTLSMPKKYYWNEENKLDSTKMDVIQNISGNGKFSVTDNWMVTYGLGLDISKMVFNQPRIGIYRDLHCWEMNFSWIPFGRMERYEFKINVKASVFQDLKYEKDDIKRAVY